MNLMGVVPAKIIFEVIVSFEVALVSSPNIIIVAKKSKQRSVRNKLVILQLIGIIKIKRSVIYTCRYSSEHFNPYNSAYGLND